MNTTVVITDVSPASLELRSKELNREKQLSKLGTQWTVLLLVSGSLGVGSGVVGVVLNALFLFGVLKNEGALGLTAVLLLVAAFPLLFLTAHCLDRVDAINSLIRLER